MYSFEEMYRRKDPRQNQLQWLNPAVPPPAQPVPTGRSIADLLAATSTAPAATPPFAGGPYPTPPANIGTTVSPSLSPLGRKLAQLRTLQSADVSSKVTPTDWGYEVAPPAPSSRKKQALLGLLQGANTAAQATKGDPLATLAGGVTGAAAGAISPRLMEALARHQEIQHIGAEGTQLAELELKNAQIDETRAQTAQRAAMAQMEVYTDPDSGEQYNLRSGDAAKLALRQRELKRKAEEEKEGFVDYTPPGGGPTRRIKASEAARLDEDYTEHQRKPPGTRPTRTLNGQIWERSDEGVWAPASGSPPPEAKRDIPGEKRTEKQEEARAKSTQAQKLFQKGHEYWETAKQKRAEASQLASTVQGRVQNKARIEQLEREAAGLEEQTRKVQQKGDELDAEANSVGTAAPAKGGRTLQGAIDAFTAAKGRVPTATEIANMKRALGQ